MTDPDPTTRPRSEAARPTDPVVPAESAAEGPAAEGPAVEGPADDAVDDAADPGSRPPQQRSSPHVPPVSVRRVAAADGPDPAAARPASSDPPAEDTTATVPLPSPAAEPPAGAAASPTPQPPSPEAAEPVPADVPLHRRAAHKAPSPWFTRPSAATAPENAAATGDARPGSRPEDGLPAPRPTPPATADATGHAEAPPPAGVPPAAQLPEVSRRRGETTRDDTLPAPRRDPSRLELPRAAPPAGPTAVPGRATGPRPGDPVRPGDPAPPGHTAGAESTAEPPVRNHPAPVSAPASRGAAQGPVMPPARTPAMPDTGPLRPPESGGAAARPDRAQRCAAPQDAAPQDAARSEASAASSSATDAASRFGARPPADVPSGKEDAAAAAPRSRTGLVGRERLWAALWPPRFSRAQLVVGVLLAVLGAAVAIQVRSNTIDAQLRDARPDDLVNILDELAQKNQQYQQELQTLQSRRDELANSNDRSQAALRDAQQQANTLGILAGTDKATGPGIIVTVRDTARQVKAAQLLDTLEELRAAGAEVIQINTVRVVTTTYVVDGAPGTVVVDGTTLSAPYTFKAIGAPADLQRALNIPGGAVPTLQSAGAAVSLVQAPSVLIDATVAPDDPRFARSAP